MWPRPRNCVSISRGDSFTFVAPTNQTAQEKNHTCVAFSDWFLRRPSQGCGDVGLLRIFADLPALRLVRLRSGCTYQRKTRPTEEPRYSYEPNRHTTTETENKTHRGISRKTTPLGKAGCFGGGSKHIITERIFVSRLPRKNHITIITTHY